MDKIVYIVGTDHRFQGRKKFLFPATKHQLDEFKTFLKKAIHNYGICSVAEEMNEEHLTNFADLQLPPKKSIPYLAAEELSLRHKYCDPERARRAELNIPEDDSDENKTKRELEWLAQLSNFGPFPCLFVLGSNHTSSFSALLATSGFTPILLKQEWWPTDRPLFE